MSHLLVIGGTSGIGKATVRAADRSDIFDTISAIGHEDFDVRSAQSVEQTIRDVGDGNPITHTVFSAGVASLQMIPNLLNDSLGKPTYRRDEFETVYDVNVFGFLRVLSALSRSFARGRVLAIVSDASRTPMRGSIAYCSSKAALAMAVKVAARELAPMWQVNGVSPCVVEDTPMTDWIDSRVPGFRGWEPEKAREYERASIPMGRRASKEEVADIVITTITGPEFLTGSIIDITGGK
jgi:NAD(P)-dependent dehydrogenase (short-subunit alcohol dehydrogenase family)